MAAPLVGSRNLNCTATELRSSLYKCALDLGPAGQDTKCGFGLVQAKAADSRIKALGCSTEPFALDERPGSPGRFSWCRRFDRVTKPVHHSGRN